MLFDYNDLNRLNHKSMAKPTQAILLQTIKQACLTNVTLSQEQATRFFKLSSYSKTDCFLGITVPNLRKIAKQYANVSLRVLTKLLQSSYNEERLLALLILIQQYQLDDTLHQQAIVSLYLKNINFVNNWNLVDASAHLILGHYLWRKERSILTTLAQSQVMWERRIAIVATWYFIRLNDVSTTFRLAKILLNDSEDLIHKAVGWMLREAGKKNQARLIRFLLQYNLQMPKTMLRYAMEKLSSRQRQAILSH